MKKSSRDTSMIPPTIRRLIFTYKPTRLWIILVGTTKQSGSSFIVYKIETLSTSPFLNIPTTIYVVEDCGGSMFNYEDTEKELAELFLSQKKATNGHMKVVKATAQDKL